MDIDLVLHQETSRSGKERRHPIHQVKLASEIHRQVQAKQDEISLKKISEYEIIEIAENVCNLKKREADWILKIDIVEKGDKLELVEQDSEGQSNTGCKTIERACKEVLDHAYTDVAEYLHSKKPQLDSLVNYICKDLTGVSRKKPPPAPKDRVPGEPFIAKSEKEAEIEKLLKSMEVWVMVYHLSQDMSQYFLQDLSRHLLQNTLEDS